MSVVTIAEAWPAAGRPFTVAELDRMPDDGRRYELLEGVLIVSPRPTTVHQFVSMRLLRILADACPDDLCVVPEPAVELGPQTEFDPDLVVVGMDQIGGAKFTEPPLLIIEIRSPSTALVDLNRKKAVYERFGVSSYWIVNPDPPPAGTDRLRTAGRPLRSHGQDVRAVRHRPPVHREHRSGRPDPRTARLNAWQGTEVILPFGLPGLVAGLLSEGIPEQPLRLPWRA